MATLSSARLLTTHGANLGRVAVFSRSRDAARMVAAAREVAPWLEEDPRFTVLHPSHPHGTTVRVTPGAERAVVLHAASGRSILFEGSAHAINSLFAWEENVLGTRSALAKEGFVLVFHAMMEAGADLSRGPEEAVIAAGAWLARGDSGTLPALDTAALDVVRALCRAPIDPRQVSNWLSAADAIHARWPGARLVRNTAFQALKDLGRRKSGMRHRDSWSRMDALLAFGSRVSLAAEPRLCDINGVFFSDDPAMTNIDARLIAVSLKEERHQVGRAGTYASMAGDHRLTRGELELSAAAAERAVARERASLHGTCHLDIVGEPHDRPREWWLTKLQSYRMLGHVLRSGVANAIDWVIAPEHGPAYYQVTGTSRYFEGAWADITSFYPGMRVSAVAAPTVTDSHDASGLRIDVPVMCRLAPGNARLEIRTSGRPAPGLVLRRLRFDTLRAS